MNVHNFDMNNWSMHGFGLIFWIIIIGLAIWLIVYFISRINKGTTSESPLDTLKKRFARGEISREEFIEVKKVIEKN